ncbi:MAG: hypothetical protein PHH30_11170 [Bacteroidales bacterium]|nr:hypothetical protein [Bacteroidales bacterium]
MRKKLAIYIFVLFCIIFNSCSIGRYLDSPAFVIIDGPNDFVVSNEEFKYLDLGESDKYEIKFLMQLETALEKHNIYSMRIEPTNTDKLFMILISEISFKESTKTEVIASDTFPDSQEVYNVVSCYAGSEFDVYNIGLNGNELLKSTSAYTSKEEKLSNKRTFWQMIFRVNKDNSIYTYTELPEDVFMDLCEKNANKTAAKISKVLYKALK